LSSLGETDDFERDLDLSKDNRDTNWQGVPSFMKIGHLLYEESQRASRTNGRNKKQTRLE